MKKYYFIFIYSFLWWSTFGLRFPILNEIFVYIHLINCFSIYSYRSRNPLNQWSCHDLFSSKQESTKAIILSSFLAKAGKFNLRGVIQLMHSAENMNCWLRRISSLFETNHFHPYYHFFHKCFIHYREALMVLLT